MSRSTEPPAGHSPHCGKPNTVPQVSGSARPEAARRSIEDRLWRPGLILRVFLPFAIGFYLSYLFRTISALIADPLTAEFALSSGCLGLLTSAYFLTFAAAQLPVGIALDRYGPRRVQSILLLVAAGGAALFAASGGFASLLIGRGLIGLGVAGALTAGLKATVLWFPKERLSLVNGAMIMFGALGAVTATTPSEWLLAWIGWRGIFEMLVVMTAGAAVVIYLLVPEAPLRIPTLPNDRPFTGFRTIYSDPRFWRLAPLAATTIGTAWALQSLWAASWLNDVEGLGRARLVHHLFAMAITLSFGALLLGIAADRLRRRGLDPQKFFGIIAVLFIVAQVALISRWAFPSYVLWCAVAAVGSGTVLSYAAVAEYFPRELAGRANAALNVFHIGGAFLLQGSIGIIIQQWPIRDGHYPVCAYQVAFAANVALQAAAWIWFSWPRLTATIRTANWFESWRNRGRRPRAKFA